MKSNPINFIIIKDGEKKFNLSSPDYYDLSVKLEELSPKNATITIKEIYEEINPSMKKRKFLVNPNIFSVGITLIPGIVFVTIGYKMLRRKKNEPVFLTSSERRKTKKISF